MKPRDRVLAALSRRDIDRPPVINPTSIACVELMESTGAFFPEAHLDPTLMARLAAAGHTLLGFDSVAPVFSVIQEAAALGAEIDWGEPALMPVVNYRKGVTCREPEDISVPADFLNREPIVVVLEAIRQLRKDLGDEVAIIGKVIGPWTLGYHLFTTENLLIDIILDPAKLRSILERLKQVQVPFARAQVEAGADIIVWADHCTSDLCRAESYHEFLFPIHRELSGEIGVPTILHICGRTVDRMNYIAEAGFTAFHYDTKNEPVELQEIVDGRILLTGGVNNPETLYAGTPANVEHDVVKALKAGIQLVSPECAIPLLTPMRNLKAIVEHVELCSAAGTAKSGG